MRLSEREKIFVLIGLSVLIIAIYIQYLILPQSRVLNDLKNKYTFETKSYNNIKHTLSSKELDAKISQIKQKLENGTDEITQTVDLEHYIINLDQNMKASGVQLKSMQFNINSQSQAKQIQSNIQENNQNKSNLYKEYGITLDVTGAYKNISNFLYLLQDNNRLTDIKSVSITRSNNTLESNINISIYYYSDSLNRTKSTISVNNNDPFKALGTTQNTTQNTTQDNASSSGSKTGSTQTTTNPNTSSSGTNTVTNGQQNTIPPSLQNLINQTIQKQIQASMDQYLKSNQTKK